MVIRLPVVVDRTRSRMFAGHGRYSYCHPASGFSPSWFAVMAVEKMNCGISDYLPATVRVLLESVETHRDSHRVSSDRARHPRNTVMRRSERAELLQHRSCASARADR